MITAYRQTNKQINKEGESIHNILRHGVILDPPVYVPSTRHRNVETVSGDHFTHEAFQKMAT